MSLQKRGWRAYFHLHLDSSTTIAALQYYTAMQSFPCVAKRIGLKIASQGRMRRMECIGNSPKGKGNDGHRRYVEEAERMARISFPRPFL
jgi:hypothetical protein